MNWGELLMAHGLTVGAGIVAGAIAWGKLQEQHRAHKDESKRRIEELEQRCEHYDQLIERFAALATDIRWIKEGLRERRSGGGDHNHGRND